MKNFFFILLIFALFASANSYALQANLLATFDLSKKEEEVSFWVKKSETEILPENLLQNNNFVPYSKELFDDKNAFYYAKILVKNTSEFQVEKIIQIGKKRSSDIAEMYVFDGNLLIKKHKSGLFVPKKEKEIQKELGSKFFLFVPSQKTYTVFFKIKNISGYKPNFEIEVYQKQKLSRKIADRNIKYGILLGVFFIMFVYNILIYFQNRKAEYLFYSLYIVSIVLNFATERGLAFEYLFFSVPKINPFFFISVTSLATFAYFYFIRKFMDTANVFPKWDIVFKLMALANLGIGAVLLLYLFITFDIPLAFEVSNLLNMVVLIIGLSFLVFLIKKKNKLAKYFISGSAMLGVGSVLSISILIANVPVNFDAKIFMFAGTVGQILMFSLGLGYKMKISEEEKIDAQKNLIIQLKRNEELQTKVNRELEQKVKERTQEIENQKEKLSEQNGMLVEKNEEIRQIAEEIRTQAEALEDANEILSLTKAEQAKMLEQKNASINYAKRIQTAMLPESKTFEQIFSDYFIFFEPRDVVSGDFYWIKKIDDTVILTAADCTGHGVPGAFLSMLGISLLNEITRKEKTVNAAKILSLLRDNLKTSLKQTDFITSAKDGIDLALCTLNLEKMSMNYAGAHNPLLILRNAEVVEYKADRMPIGIYKKERPFTNHEIKIFPKDRIYMFSDGFADQFGGENSEKFKTANLKLLLKSIQSKTMQEQKTVLESTLKSWQGTNKRLDDILILGVEV